MVVISLLVAVIPGFVINTWMTALLSVVLNVIPAGADDRLPTRRAGWAHRLSVDGGSWDETMILVAELWARA